MKCFLPFFPSWYVIFEVQHKSACNYEVQYDIFILCNVHMAHPPCVYLFNIYHLFLAKPFTVLSSVFKIYSMLALSVFTITPKFSLNLTKTWDPLINLSLSPPTWYLQPLGCTILLSASMVRTLIGPTYE